MFDNREVETEQQVLQSLGRTNREGQESPTGVLMSKGPDIQEDEQRLKVLYVSPQIIMQCFDAVVGKDYYRVVQMAGLPDGYKVRSVSWDLSRQCFAFQIEHPSFDLVPVGALLPTAEAWLTTTVVPKAENRKTP